MIRGLTTLKLADLANFTLPWSIDNKDLPEGSTISLPGFKNTTRDLPIPLEDLEREFCRLLEQPYPIAEMIFVRSWMLFRVGFPSF